MDKVNAIYSIDLPLGAENISIRIGVPKRKFATGELTFLFKYLDLIKENISTQEFKGE